jgi:probable HAF family extracellular repeat protein
MATARLHAQAHARPFAIGILAAAAGLPCAAQTVPTVTAFALPGATRSEALCITPDGTVVGGWSYSAGFANEQPMRWTRQTGAQAYAVLPGGLQARVTAISADGIVAAGHGNTSQAGLRAIRWGPSPVDLGALISAPTAQAQALGVSRDGQVVVGRAQAEFVDGQIQTRAFRWTAAGGMVDIGGYGGSPPYLAHARATSGDGAVVAGTAQPGGNTSLPPAIGFRWHDGTVTSLGVPAGYRDSIPTACSPDGTVIIGNLFQPEPHEQSTFRWTLEDGLQVIELRLPGAPVAYAEACTPDGRVIVGYNITPSVSTRAVLWTQQGGAKDLTAMLRSMGALDSGSEFRYARGISDDGTVMVGSGFMSGSCPGCERAMVIDFRGDRDGDGLLDHWEINGIPYYDELGRFRRLHLPGADPAHKDLYLEIDAMEGMFIQQDAVDMVVQAFADAPLANPDGTTGVRLHVLWDESDLQHRPLWNTGSDCWPDDFNAYYDAHLGTVDERDANGGTGESFRNAKAKAYRYGIIADGAAPKDWGGCAMVPGDKFVLFLGQMPGAVDQAAALMHEVGHTLGLHHGGNQSIQGKPNYPSIMNYTLAYRAPWSESFWRLDYAREGALLLGNLNESSLDETRGIGASNSLYASFLMPYGINDTTGRTIAFAALDGSPLDFGDAAGTGIPDGNFTTGVAQDLNYLPTPPPEIFLPTEPSPGESLTAHNDWATVVLATPAALGPGAPTPSIPSGELTITAKNWMAQNWQLPGGPPPCYANCDGSSTTPVLNVADFTCFLQRFAAGDTYANCDNSTTTPTLNVADFTCFLQRFAAGCP